ncbi:MAG: hypothetical protein IAE89_14925 [Anaerolineae bacterium]|nr:hypothetical protein [Anaerolineae bacterium]
MMPGWEWLTHAKYTGIFILRVLLKAAMLFVIINLLFALTNPIPALGTVSIYNLLAPGRLRLPYGESESSYNLSLYDLNAMFASHTLNGRRNSDEATVLVVGDSSVWGTLLENADTLASCLDQRGLSMDGRPARFYNVGYPTLSVTKDLLLLDRAMAYQPDMILWLVTLESMPRSEQLATPLVQNNASAMRNLIAAYGLDLDVGDLRFVDPDFIGRTMVGQRRALADWWRLQLYAFPWAQTGIDQVIGEYTPRSNDFDENISWYGFTEAGQLDDSALVFDVLDAGMIRAGDVPVMMVNEPIFIADGANSDLHYNFWYPRWAYDRYRQLISNHAGTQGWNYLDLWDAVPSSEFTDSPVHLTPEGTQVLCDQIAMVLEG